MPDPISLAKFSELLQKTPSRKHNYYSPDAGKFAARVVESWSKTNNFLPLTMSAHGTGVSSGTLASKLRYGLQWLAENAEPAEVRAYFADIAPKVRICTRHNSLDIELIHDPIATIKSAEDTDGLEMRADLLGWVEAIKPLRQKWERDGLRLSDENLEWFQTKIRELEERGYCGVAKRHHVMVVHYPKNLLLGDTKDQP